MTYELAKQLKDGGFPGLNDTKYRHLIFKDKNNPHIFVNQPTLSELIEACGEQFMNLTLLDGKWSAQGWRGRKYGQDMFWVVDKITPEEAVAKLWLMLSTTPRRLRPNKPIN